MSSTVSAAKPPLRSWQFTSPPSTAILPILFIVLSVVPLFFLSLGIPLHFTAFRPIGAEGQWVVSEAYGALGGGFTHAVLLLGAGFVALCSALLSFAHSATKRDPLSAVIAIALFWSGFMAIGQTIWAEGMLYWAMDMTDFIPFSWAISRMFNVSILVIGGAFVYLNRSRMRHNMRPRHLLIFFGVFGFIAIAVLLFIAYTELPQTIFRDALIKRPWDLPALALLVFGAAVVYPKLHAYYRNHFSYALWLSTIPFIAAQLYLILGSTRIFDDAFNVAYGFNFIAFLILFSGLVGEYVRTSFEEEQLIEERAQTQVQLMQLDRLSTMGTIAAGVGHEINNPLAFMIANLEYGQNELTAITANPKDFRRLETLERLKELEDVLASADIGAERIRTIVEDLRLLSSFRDALDEPMSVARALSVAIRMSRHQLRHKARLIEEIEDVPTIVGNEARLTQVLLNLLINAIHALPERPLDENEILARLYATDQCVVIEISDNGVGIPTALKERIFEPFFTTKPAGKGSGLGLALSRDIVASFKGRLSVESVEGKGSTFRIELPR